MTPIHRFSPLTANGFSFLEEADLYESRHNPAPPILQPTAQTNAAYKHYKRAPIPAFTGTKKENISDWIFLIETHFNADGLNDAQKVNMDVGYLRDLPLTTYRRLTREKTSIYWNDLKHHLTAEFQPFELQMQLRQELVRLKQQGNNYDDFLQKFNFIVNRIIDMSQKDQIVHFVNGLQSRTADEIRVKRPNNLTEAIEIANCYEQKYSFHHSDEHRDNKQQHQQPSRPPFRTFNRPQWSAQPARSFAPAMQNKDTKTCFTCKAVGHYSNQCPKKTTSSTSGSVSFKPGERKPFVRPNERFSEGQRHVKTFMVTSNNQPDEIIKITGQINNHVSTFVLGGGATASIISRKLVERYKIKFFETNNTIQTASTAPPIAVQRTEKCRLEVHGSVVHISFLVLGSW